MQAAGLLLGSLFSPEDGGDKFIKISMDISLTTHPYTSEGRTIHSHRNEYINCSAGLWGFHILSIF
jgi:hypothetical protein